MSTNHNIEQTVAFLISRQTKRPAPHDWWICATLAATKWATKQDYHLYSSGGLLNLDFVRWAHAHAGGDVTLVDISNNPAMRRRRKIVLRFGNL